MPQRHVGFLLFVLVLLPGQRPISAQETKPLQILFIGNSHTYVNDLPKMVAELAKAGGQRVIITERETPGGWSYKKQWEGNKAVPKIQSKKWDYVVLQDHSTGALAARDDMFVYGKKLHEAAKKQGAKTLLYMTWARQDKPGEQAQITQAFKDLGKELGVPVVPAGEAWGMALKADPKLVLHNKDKNHAAPAGTYLTACCFYATLFGKSPEGLPGKIAGLTD